MITFKAAFYVLAVLGSVWLFTVGSVLFAFDAFSRKIDASPNVANGAIYLSSFAMAILLTIAIIFPALLMLQPVRLWHVLNDEKDAITPRQRFRGEFCCLSSIREFTYLIAAFPVHIECVPHYYLYSRIPQKLQSFLCDIVLCVGRSIGFGFYPHFPSCRTGRRTSRVPYPHRYAYLGFYCVMEQRN